MTEFDGQMLEESFIHIVHPMPKVSEYGRESVCNKLIGHVTSSIVECDTLDTSGIHLTVRTPSLLVKTSFLTFRLNFIARAHLLYTQVFWPSTMFRMNTSLKTTFDLQTTPDTDNVRAT